MAGLIADELRLPMTSLPAKLRPALAEMLRAFGVNAKA